MSRLFEMNNKFEQCAREVMDAAVREFCGDSYSFANMDENTFKALRGLIRLADVALDLQRETNRTLDNINKRVIVMEQELSIMESKVH